jgi:fibronectin-binding autotransporter adhesin
MTLAWRLGGGLAVIPLALGMAVAQAQTTSTWEHNAQGQIVECLAPGQCVQFPDNVSWTQDQIIGPHPFNGSLIVTLAPSNWSTPLYPDNNRGGNWIAVIGAPAPTVLGSGVALDGLIMQPAGSLFLNAGGSINIVRTDAGAFSNAGTITMAGSNQTFAFGSALRFAGGVQSNSGTINLSGTAVSSASIELKGNTTLTGGGKVVMTDVTNPFGFPTGATIFGSGGINPVLTNDVGHTIQGGGNLGAGSLSFVNKGLISAESATGRPMVIAPNGSGAINTGIMQATNGGSLILLSLGTPYVVNNTGGTIQADGVASASNVQVRGGVTITGGTVQVLGAGVLSLQGSTITGGQIVNSSTGLIDALSATSTTLGGTIVNPTGGRIRLQAGSGQFFSPDTVIKLQAGTQIANDGNVEMVGSGGGPNGSRLQLLGNVTLTGGGTVTGADFNTGAFGTIGTERLSNQGNTIQGSGNYFSLGIDNQGKIDANTNGGLILLSPGAAGTTNNGGIMQASNGGVLRLQGPATFDNTGGTLRALDGSSVQFNGAVTVKGGTLATQGSGGLHVLSTQTLTLDGAQLAAGGRLFVDPGTCCLNNSHPTTLNLKPGSFDNRGTVFLSDNAANSGGGSILRVDGGTLTLTGGGTIDLANNRNNGAQGRLGNETLINQDNLIRGAGTLGYGSLGLVNHGTVIANGNATGQQVDAGLFFTPRSGVGGGVVNTGTIKAEGTGFIVFANPAQIDNTGGLIDVGTSFAFLTGGQLIKGGTLASTGPGAFHLASGADGTLGPLTNNALIFVQQGTPRCFFCDRPTTLNLQAGSYVNNGQILLSDTGAGVGSVLRLLGNVTLDGTGELVINPYIANNVQNLVANVQLTNGVGHTIRGGGQLGIGSLGGLSIVNNGVVQSDTNATMIVQTNGTGFTNNGTLRALQSGGLFMPTGVTNYNAQTKTLTGGSYQALGGFLQFASGDIVTNKADIRLDGTGSILKLNGANALTALATNAGGGSLTLTGGSVLAVAGNLANAGTVEIGGGSQLKVKSDGSGTYVQTDGLTRVNGQLVAGLTDIQGGALKGAGTVVGDLHLGSGAIMSPGNSPGVLQVTGDYTLDPGATLMLELAGLGAGEFDQLLIGGVADLEGLLDVAFLSGFTPGDGSVFKLMGFASHTGDFFSGVDIGGLDGSYSFNLTLRDTELDLIVHRIGTQPNPVPEPSTLSLLGLGLAALTALRLQRGRGSRVSAPGDIGHAGTRDERVSAAWRRLLKPICS